MTTTIIITICSLLLTAYLFDLTSSRTKIPSVILLLLVGFIARQASDALEIRLPDLSTLLPVFGTVGLILIVLEGSLELELHRSKIGLIRRSFWSALLPVLGLSLILATVLYYSGTFSFKDCLVNAIPLAVISSSIAIPSAKNLSTEEKEFVVFESSLSDIFGVLFFNFVALNEVIDVMSFAHFGWQLLVICVVSFIATIGLAFLLGKIKHHIKYTPIVILVILIYTVSKLFHLPSLLFIMLFGLFLGNINSMHRFKWISRLKPAVLNREVQKLREILGEGTFLIRSIFFLLFGFLMEMEDLLNLYSLQWAAGIVGLIFIFRYAQLKFMKHQVKPLVFIAPRGLITVLLFLSVSPDQVISLVDKSLVVQVVILTAFVMMAGLMMNRSARQN